MALSKTQLIQKLSDCKISDKFKFRRGLDRLKGDGKPKDLEQLEKKIDESCEWVSTKRQLKTVIDYPDLPISERREEISKAIEANQVVILAGETGSGKTTQLPKICLDLGLGCKGLIGHTQPRRLAARTVAERIAEELNTSPGERVGYQVRFFDQVSDATQVKLMTDGILLAETQNDRFLEKYEVLIIDEAHERSLNIDFLLGYIRQILPKRPDLKVIITSATIDLERFSKHFNNAPIIEVSGRTFPVEVLYRPLDERGDSNKEAVDINHGILSAVEEVRSFEKSNQLRNADGILVFLSGEREIREAAETLRKAQLRNTEILPLYSRLSVSEQKKIFSINGTQSRRIVLCTNVAETSVTVPGIGYVIDTGLARVSRYSYRSKVQRLPVEKISQASANQRAGRCGRIAPGTCIRLFSREDYESRPEFTDAEIRRTNLAAVILQMLHLKLGNISQFPFIDPPDSRFINDGFKLLEELSAVTKQKLMTPLGRTLAKLPVDPRIGRMIIEAGKQGSLKEVLIIASALSVQDPKERPVDKQQAADQVHKALQDDDSDFVSFLNLWNSYEEQRQELSTNQLRKYCTKHFLSFMRMREWRDVHRQLHLACKSIGLKSNSTEASYQSVHVALLSGLLSHVGFKQENKEFLGARNRKFFIFPASTQYKKPAKWLMVSELVETSRLYGRIAAKIEPEWIEPLAQHIVKKNYIEPKWQKRRAQVTAYEQVVLFGMLIVNKRVVNYSNIDPEVCQEIFIRSGLVEGNFFTKGKFFQHNRALLNDIELLEAKSRRKDILVDEDALCDFYTDKISSNSTHVIVNGASFEKWRKKIEQDNPEALYMKEEDIVQRTSDHVGADDYPDTLTYKGIDLLLTYNFDPAAIDDGVSLHLPIALLKQFSKERLHWLVPGLIEERCNALLKSLPKARRKHFVPVPNYVNAFMQSCHFAQGDLFDQLSHHLLRMTGVKIESAEFSPSALAPHLHFNIKVIGNNAKQIDQSRDIDLLIKKNAHLVDEKLQQEAEKEWGEKDIQTWNFGRLPEQIEVQQGGIMVTAYPSLMLTNQKIDLKLVMNRAWANRCSAHAIAQLMLNSIPQVVKNIRKKIPKINESILFSGKKFNKKILEDEIISFGVREVFALFDSLPRDVNAFDLCLKSLIKETEFGEWIIKVGNKIHELHSQYHRLQKALNGAQSLSTIIVVSDIKQQLERLFNKNYLSNISWYRLEQYTRYMKSIEMRLEKFQRELPRQTLLSKQIQEIETRVITKLKQDEEQQIYDADIDSYRWLVEEYRISVFSQQIKTLETVSEKRMQQKWKELIKRDT